jgi:phosphatidylinositol dimannoside acyltransferase
VTAGAAHATGHEDQAPSLRGRLIIAASIVLARLPEAPLVAAAESLGEVWYRVDRRRAARARANLGRVAAHLLATGAGPARVRRAGNDPEALERLVRSAFRHAVRYYLEVARASSYEADGAIARIDVETPEVVEAALTGGPTIIVGAHFGAIELPVRYLSHRMGHPVTAPMETVGDPGLARWFASTRGRAGVRVVAIADARRELLAALRRGESVGVVADRDLTGGGVPVTFFGRLAPMPVGPALLAMESGAAVYVASCRRADGHRYRGRMIAVPVPVEGSRRERMLALTAAITSGLESVVTDAPEQWWGAFHPIWRDLDPGEGAGTAADEGDAA